MKREIFGCKHPDVVGAIELCQMLSIGKNTAYQLLQTGEIKSVRVGTKYIIPTCWIEEYLERNKK